MSAQACRESPTRRSKPSSVTSCSAAVTRSSSPLVKLTEAEFNKLAETAPNVVSEETIRASEQLNDTIDRLKQGFQGLLAQGLSKVIPVITSFIEWLQRVAAPVFRRDVLPAIRELLVEVKSLQPVFQAVFKVVRTVVFVAIQAMVIRLQAMLGILQGLIMFVKGVFTLDWRLAWAGVQKVFNSAWTAIRKTLALAWQAIGRLVVDGINVIIRAVNGLVREFNSLGGKLRPGFTKLGEIGEIAHRTLGLVTQATRQATAATEQYRQEVAVASPAALALASATDVATAASGRATAAINAQTKAHQSLRAAQGFIAESVLPILAARVTAAQAAFNANESPGNASALGRAQAALDDFIASRNRQVAAGLPALQAGGIVRRPTVALIGEAGPEAVVPLGRGGAGGNIYLTINIDNNFEGTTGTGTDGQSRQLARRYASASYW